MSIPTGPTAVASAAPLAPGSPSWDTTRAQAQVLALLPAPVRETLRRCAVARTFGPETYRALLRPADGPDLDLLVRLGQLEPTPGKTDRYRLRAEVREAALLDWWVDDGRPPTPVPPVPARLREHASSLSAAPDPGGSRLDRLSAVLLHDAGRAGQAFRELYAEADDRHDLARCRAVLDVLDAADRLPLLPSELVTLRNEYAAYLAARTLWVDDYYRSAYYVSRPPVEQALDQLLAGDRPRVLQLYARGGMGKSMQLRWFIARRAVPNRVPCARLDFDAVQPVVAARLPWLLLLDAAAQLDQQLPGRPFQELLAAHGRYRALLPNASRRAETESPPRHAAADDGEDVAARFCAILREIGATRPVVLVVDTVEEILRPSVNPTGLVRLLEQVVAATPAVRVVLAGRYDLREPGRPVARVAMASLGLQPLTRAEQDTYLMEIRGIRPDLVEAIRWLSRGLPLTLSLYANLVSEAQSIDAEQLRSCDDPGLLAAVTRVVKRVDDPRVRWLLRYGVIPRRLSFDFVRSVMWPYLREGMSGQSTVDAPGADQQLQDPERPVFPTDVEPPRDDTELQEVWDGLLSYAADYGWVSVEPDGVVRFRPDLQEPLRSLIQRHEVFRSLQRDAAAFFEDKARAEPTKWATWMREAIFHGLYVDAASSARAWQAAVDHARSLRRNEWCLELATDLLGGEFVDWNGEPIAPMTPQLLAHAHLERARAAAVLADERTLSADERTVSDQDRTVTEEDPYWNDVEYGLAAAEALARAHPEVTLPGAAVLQARLCLARGDALAAEEQLRRHRQDLEPSRELADLERTLGQALHRLRRPDAAEHLDSSYRIAVQVADLAGAQLSALLIVDRWVQQDRYKEALAALARARADHLVAGVEDETDDGVDDRFDLVEATVLAVAGQPESGQRRGRELQDRTSRYRAEAHLALGMAAYFADDPLAAVQSCTTALRCMEEAPGSGQDQTDFALALRGAAWAEVHMYDRAIDDLLAAASRARALRNPEAAADHAAEAALIQIRVTGDLRQAAQCLDEAERSMPGPATPGWAKVALARGRLEFELGDIDGAAASFAQTRRVLADLDAPPNTRITAALATLALPVPSPPAAPAAHRAALAELVQQLTAVSPAGARCWMLSDLRYVPSLGPIDPAMCAELVALVQPVPDPAASEAEQATREWCRAEVLRVAGDRPDARRALDRALRHRGSDLLGWWRWLDGVSRLGDPQPGEPVPPPELMAEPSQTPVLAAACLITLGRRRLRLDPVEVTEQRLDAAAEILDQPGRPSLWSARLALARAELDGLRDQTASAHRHASEAAGLLGRLGATTKRDEVADRYVLGRQTPREEDGSVEIYFGPRREEAVEITVRRTGEPDIVRQVSLESIGSLSFRQTQARIRHVTGALAKNWRNWSAEVAEQILVPELRMLTEPGPGRQRDIRIVSDSRDLAAWPWELLRAWHADVPLARAPGVGVVYRSLPAWRREEAKVRALQGALGRLDYFSGVPDGLVGALTTEALSRFQQEAGLVADGIAGHDTWAALRQAVASTPSRQPHALVLRPDPKRGLEKQRGSRASGAGLVATYLRHGFTVEVLDDPTPEGVLRPARSSAWPVPDLVHIVASVRYTGGATVLDLGRDAGLPTLRPGGDSTGELTITGLCELLTLLLRGGRAPLVVLDVPLPSSRPEALRSVTLRNSFAHQLLYVAPVEAVLATGLAHRRDEEELLERVVGGLGHGHDPAEVLTDLHHARSGEEDVQSVLTFLGAALFADRSPSALLPLG